jgi:hypothetical protein
MIVSIHTLGVLMNLKIVYPSYTFLKIIHILFPLGVYLKEFISRSLSQGVYLKELSQGVI